MQKDRVSQFDDILGERSSDKTHMQCSNLAERLIKVIHTMDVKFGRNRVTYDSSYIESTSANIQTVTILAAIVLSANRKRPGNSNNIR